MAETALVRPDINTVAATLKKMAPQLAMALPKHLSAERMIRIVLTCVQKNPKLLQCTRDSFLGAVVQAAQLGLEPDGLLGEAHLVPYKDKCQLIIGYKGMLKLSRNSGQISTITARVVYAKDEFRYSYGLNEVLEHVPSDDEDAGPAIAVYAVARLKDGGVQMEVMTTKQINRVRDGSQGYQMSKRFGKDSPWDTHWDEMAKKTVLRRLAKMLPASVELQRAVALDERGEADLPQDLGDVLSVEGIELPPEPAASEPPQGRRMSLKKGADEAPAEPATAEETNS